MIPRKKLDIGWGDLAWGLARAASSVVTAATLPHRAERLRRTGQARLEARWDAEGSAVATLSVRSGFDLLLTTLRLPRGSEILCSAVTIADMATIARAHGLVVVPVDMDMTTLSVTSDALERAWSPRSRLLLVAHLFGSRMPLDNISRWARTRDLLVIEDAAQAFTGDAYRGHPGSDVSLFSFGPIKTGTCLGGGLLRFRDPGLAARVREAQERHPVQTESRFLRRAFKYAFIALLLTSPAYSTFVALCRARGVSHDALINGAVRGFAGEALLSGIRHQPSGALLSLMERRLAPHRQAATLRGVETRIAHARDLLASLPHLPRPGTEAGFHSHWVVPFQVLDPDLTGEILRRAGIDATRGASSLAALPPPWDRSGAAPEQAHRVMEQVLYLPCHPRLAAGNGPTLQALTPPPSPSPSRWLSPSPEAVS